MTEEVEMEFDQQRVDNEFMDFCIGLSEEAARNGDLPFGSVVVFGGNMIGHGRNELQKLLQVDRHAERLALLGAQSFMGVRSMPECTIYSTVEPCPGCSFLIRELMIRRVVIGLRSPVMGGISQYAVLGDPGLSDKLPDYFGPPPIVVEGVRHDDVAAVWERYVPETWRDFQSRGILV